ncbi:hypothetical protein AC579_114 [Pseudocercospora musae]|uniref:Uncharacterized protein n=1 Tax=Pseudocercospora musae TaxID=113226 RepID=A0A139HIB0_9PEZI|nr:hypothetical protein AC579_114 [Pseudocercospora musae]
MSPPPPQPDKATILAAQITNLENKNKTLAKNLRIAEEHIEQAYGAMEELRREHREEVARLKGAIEGILDARIRAEEEGKR